MALSRSLLALIATVVLSSCGGDAGAPRSSDASTATTPTASPAEGAGTELTADLLAALARGLRREMDAVRAARTRSSEAATSRERGEAIQQSFEHATIPLGAEAAGLPVERYQAVRETVDTIFRTLDIQGKIDGPISMDLTRVDEATRQRLLRDPLADLSPSSADALRNSMDQLVPVWVEYVSLTAVAG